MKLENLKEGMVIKNYKDLCKTLNIPVKTGRSKQNQLQWVEDYVEYHRDGYKFVIDDVYMSNTVVSRFDSRSLTSGKNQKGAYGKYIRLLILNMLSESYANSNNVLILSRLMMLSNLNMINNNYRTGNYNRCEMAKYLGIDVRFVNEFYDTNTRKMKESVERALNRLMNNEKLIFWNNVKMVKISNEYREATNEEVKFITNCESQTLKDMNVENIVHIIISNRSEEYYEKLNKKTIKRGINFSFNAYKIIFSDLVYEKNEQLQYKLEVKDEEDNKKQLNDRVNKNLLNSAVNRHNKSIEEREVTVLMGIPKPKWLNNTKYKQLILDDDFICSNEEMINMCIDYSNTIDLYHELYNIKQMDRKIKDNQIKKNQ